jgi:hypothetical protein
MLMKSIKSIFAKKKKDIAANVDSILRIDCRGCDNDPDYGSTVCLCCMAGKVSPLGVTDRIVLRGGSECEYSGDAVRIVTELSAVLSDGCRHRDGQRCAQCRFSPDALNDKVRASFDVGTVEKIITELESSCTDSDDCASCVEASKGALAITKGALSEANADALRSAYRIMGV